MSLDDPAVMAGIAVDGQPFFSHSHNQQDHENHDQGLLTTDVGPDMDTPMPMKRGAPPILEQRPATSSGIPSGTTMGLGGLPTPSRDADTRELKEFWKQYMRTPLSGPGPAGLEYGANATNNKTGGTPYRRQRVSSLPSAKTPGVERGEWDSLIQNGYMYQQQQGPNHQQGRQVEGPKQGSTSSMRTTLHGNSEDLRSYEAAVMARKAPTMLNLQVRRPLKTKGGPPDSRAGSESATSSPQMTFGSNSRPGSAVDSSKGSSTSPATVQNANNPSFISAARVMFAKETSSSPSLSSRASSVDPDGTSGMSSDGDSLRPSFKRLPSQTLGPANTKRAFLGFGNDVEGRERAPGWGTGSQDLKSAVGMSHPDRVVASIAERRRRRMSAPSTGDIGQPSRPNSDVSGLGYAPAAQGGMAG